ncbi:hypothetical protein HDU80_006124 [Chytriomyces hyalinus]|nr:hypothetical protein HDU80_006124 [Chytriomyces hyalinus]
MLFGTLCTESGELIHVRIDSKAGCIQCLHDRKVYESSDVVGMDDTVRLLSAAFDRTLNQRSNTSNNSNDATVTIVQPSASNKTLTMMLLLALTPNESKPSDSKTSNNCRILSLAPATPTPALAMLLCHWLADIAKVSFERGVELARTSHQPPPILSSAASTLGAVQQPIASLAKRAAPKSLLNPRVKIRATKETSFVSDNESE